MNEKEIKAASLFLSYMTNGNYTEKTHKDYAKAYKNLMKGVKSRIKSGN